MLDKVTGQSSNETRTGGHSEWVVQIVSFHGCEPLCDPVKPLSDTV